MVGRGQPPRLGLGEGNGLFWPSQQPPRETGQGTRPAILCAPLKSGNILLPASPPPLTLPERLRLGLAAQRVLSWGCGGGEGTGPGVGWQSRSSQVRQEFLAAPHVSHASFHFPSPPPAVGGPSRPPGSTITCPSAPCHLLKISPTRSGSFSVLMSVYPMLTLTPPHKENNRKNRCELGCGVAQLGLLPQRYVLGCMPGVVEEPSPAAESRLKLTSGFFAATLATFAGGGCSVDWE